MRRVIHGVAFVTALAATAWAQPSADPENLRAGAWDRSVQLEQSGDLEGARTLLWQAWGTTPEGYEVTVRLAWLSLQMGDADNAVAGYRRAKDLEGAGPEAQQGLASAHAQRGFARLDRGDKAGAREDFGAALAMEPGHAEALRGLDAAGPASHVDPELWLGAVHQSFPQDRWTGAVLFLHIPWQVDDTWQLRAAYRYVGTALQIEGQPSGRRGRQSGGGTEFLHQHEVYGGFGFTSAYVDGQVLGIGVMPPDEDAVPGAGLQLRAGSTFGLQADAAALRRSTGWNLQVAPGVYVWPSPTVGLAAGVRHTNDEAGGDTSGWAGFSWARKRSELHVRGHLGTERWAFSAAEPSVLTLTPETWLGGNAALLLPVSPTWQLGLQAQVETLRLDDTKGIYAGASIGLRWSPALQRGDRR